MSYYISPGPLCDWCKYCTIPQHKTRHSGRFRAISISPISGIIFKANEYSATQLADAFEDLIPGHMDFDIKRRALARWNTLLPEIVHGSSSRDTEFDLKDTFSVLDDFLFLRALRNRCRVEWVDECRTGWKRYLLGWCEPGEETNRGPTQWIRIVRPTVDKPATVQDILCILMHEMCHALFALKCICSCCCCPLTRINSEGLDGHGPSWERLRRSVESTANTYLNQFEEAMRLCSPSEPQVVIEQEATGKMLSGLYQRITQQGSKSAELKRRERARRGIIRYEQTEQGEYEWLDTVDCASIMFKKFERRAR